MRVALTQRVAMLAEYGERRDCLDQRWTAFVEALGAEPLVVPNSLREPEKFLDGHDVDLLVLTGGNDLAELPDASEPAPERDATERALLTLAAARRLPVLGICRGLQFMVASSGGALRKVDGHVRAPHAIRVAGGTGFALDDGRVVNTFHTWGIDTAALPPPWLVVATAPDGTVEAAAHGDLPQLGVMWHPERHDDFDADLELVRSLVERG